MSASRTPSEKTPPTDTIPAEEFYAQDERRRHSPVTSYGSAWRDGDWTDEDHVLEILWLDATHEIVAYYITYDWDRLGPAKAARDTVEAAAEELLVDSGLGVGRVLGDLDLATSDVHVRLLGVPRSHWECRQLLWGWPWLQHHRDGFRHVVTRIREHGHPRTDD